MPTRVASDRGGQPATGLLSRLQFVGAPCRGRRQVQAIPQAEGTPPAAQRERRPEGFPPELFDRLVADQRAYYGVALARTRGWLHGALLFVCVVATIVLVWADWFQFGAAAIGLYILTVVANFIVGGVINRNPLLLRLWRALWVLPWTAWGVGAVVGAGALYLLYAMGLLPFYGLIALVATGIAFLYQAGLMLPLRLARARHVASTLDVVKGLRASGYSEQYISEAVYAAGGPEWEEFFEAAFGYERMIAQRQTAEREKRNGGRRYHARWRDPIHQWLGDVEESLRAARSGRMLANSARKRLEATGMDEREARLKARKEALAAMEEERRRAEAMSMVAGFGPPMGMPGMPLRGPRQYDYMAGRGGVFHGMMTSLRSAVGSGIMLGFIAPQLARMAGISIPANVQQWLMTYWSWGWGGSVHALVISSIVMRNASSRRYVASAFGIAGALMLVGREKVVAIVGQPSFDAQTCVFFGCGLMMMSLGTGFLRRFTSPRGFLPF